MRFRQLDRILEIEAGRRIVAAKSLSPSEDYLRDHFPRFPVMPGVLMLEAVYQASLWLVYHSLQFSRAAVALKEARNVKFTDFVKPGETLTVTAEVLGEVGPQTKIKASGTLSASGATAVSARLVLESFDWAERLEGQQSVDALLRRDMRSEFLKLVPEGLA